MSQSGMSLYHLNNATFQGSNFNPAFIPDGKLFIGIPGLSGVMLDYNGLSYNDAIGTDEAGQRILDIDKIVRNSDKLNFISAEAEISTFYLGYRPSSTLAVSFFVRERMSAKGFYTEDMVSLWNGNTQFIGGEVSLDKALIDQRYYREYGIGIWKSLPNKGLNIGVRAKFLNGMVSVVTDKKFDGTVAFDEDNGQINFSATHANVNTSGLNIMQSTNSNDLVSHLISNGNIGFGIDLGAHLKVTKEISVALSVNDLGYINWKVDPENYILKDTSFIFEGIELKDIDNLSDAYADSLKNYFQDTTLVQSYKTGLNTSAYGSVMYQLTPNDLFTATISSHVVQSNFRMMYALAYTRKVGKVLNASLNVMRIPQQGIDVGVAAAVNLGAFQMYIASDKLLKVWNVPEASAVDFRFGINLTFGKQKVQKDDRSDLYHPSPYGKEEKVEKSDGIYWIIKKLSPRPTEEFRQY
jgi:hypothetical protein